MGNDIVTLDKATIPAHVAARIGKESKLSTALVGGISSGSVPRISIRGGRFRVVEDGNETLLPTVDLNVVIVGANPRLSKTYYAKQWTPDQEPSNPDCFSLDSIRPDPSASIPQSVGCVDCPHNAWGSRTTPGGTQVKACTDQKRLAIVSFDDVSGPIYLLQVPPASLRGLNVYHKELSRRAIPPEVVATRVTFDTDASHPKLDFGFGGFLSPEQQGVVDKLFTAEAVLEVTGEKIVTLPEPSTPAPRLNVPPVTAPKPAPVATPAAAAPPTTPPPAAASAAPAAKGKTRGFGIGAPTVVPPKPPAPAPEAQPTVVAADAPLSELEREIQNMINGTSDDASTAATQ